MDVVSEDQESFLSAILSALNSDNSINNSFNHNDNKVQIQTISKITQKKIMITL